jgi:PadR family transcriptional regulator, regulatory protein AphA
MSLKFAILGLIRNSPQSGYDINKQMDTYLKFFWTADQSQIYRALYAMKEDGWVDVETVLQEDSPNKKIYSITQKGLYELKDWLRQPAPEGEARIPWLLKVQFSDAISDEELLSLLQMRLERLKKRLDSLDPVIAIWSKNGISIPFPEDVLSRGVSAGDLTFDYGVRITRFEVEWTENAIRILQNKLQHSV